MSDATLKSALGYAKFSGTPRVLVLDSGYLVVADILEGAEDLGWTVSALPTPSRGTAAGEFVGALLKAVLRHRPDFVITVNHLGFDDGGALSRLLESYDIFTASWFVDHPMPILGAAADNTSGAVQVFCFERTALDWLSAHGYADPIYLPTGANRRRFHPERVDAALVSKLACDLSFAGNSWWTKARLEPEKSLRQAAARASKKIPVHRKALLNGFEDKVRQSVSGSRRVQYAAAQVLLAEASMQRRGEFARTLSAAGLRIYGDPHWQTLAPKAELRPFLDNKRELPGLFGASTVNANVTAAQMPTALNQRVWDVPAVGGFLLTDDQQDLFEFFEEDRSVAVYRSFEEAADKTRFYIARPEARAAIVRKGMDIVVNGHTVPHRLQRMAEVMQRRYG